MKPFAFVFPGQGAQSVGMLDAWGDHPAVREVMAESAQALGEDIGRLIREGPAQALELTTNTQPVMLAAGIACYRAWRAEGGPEPAALAGHSLGEYTALVAAGSLGIADAVRLVRERGRLMGEQTEGTLAAVVGLDEATVAAICDESGAEVANYNAPTQTVVGGTRKAVELACVLAKERGGRGLPVNVSGAFHTSLMEPAARHFATILDSEHIAHPSIPVIGNVSAEPLTATEQVRADLVMQIRSPVHWYQSMDLLEAKGVRRVIEIGPGKILTSQLKRSNPNLECVSLDEAAALGGPLESLRVSG